MSASKRFVLLLPLVLAAAPPFARADLDGEMKKFFDDFLVNTTAPGVYETQRRGVITGGGISLRNRVVRPNLINFVPPGFKAGCNGIDFFGGSFSFINAEQFQAMLRSIAQGAVGYAFSLAIEGLCPTCSQVMNKMADYIQRINALMRNSCDIAKLAVNEAGLKAWHDAQIQDAAAKASKETSLFDDFFGAIDSVLPPTGQVASNETSQTDPKKRVVVANLVKDALDDAHATEWFTGGGNDPQFKMALMSLTGSLISHPAANAADQGDVGYTYLGPILRVKDFIEGGSVEIYDCPDELCLNPGRRQTTIEGMRGRVRRMLFGTGIGAGGSGGIVRKLQNDRGQEGLTDDEKRFVEASSPGALGLLVKLASQPGAMVLVAERLTDALAVEITNRMVDEFFDTVVASLRGTGRPLDTAMLEALRDVRGQINEERRVAAESSSNVALLLQIYDTVAQSLREPLHDGTGGR
ncbi:conjugal transfer protein TraH [Methylococcus capsulatus]|jgi:conjugative transfer pilus assembly protein TraH|uniref:conjugal transfer protein TraH n=1 Tax=Methylococcus capsulatus TaxID=414 RepID=UPI001C52756B|nr:conjugal transfer protein TraH [Methylococcus capsulatus]QXP89463.1 conjugal transfer protein TraH [Methylococcus capsulatus]